MTRNFADRGLSPGFITRRLRVSSWSDRGAGEQDERLGREVDRDLALGDKRFGNRAAASLPALHGRIQVFLPLPRRDGRSQRSRRVAKVEQHERFAGSRIHPAPDRQGFLLLECSNCHVLLAWTSEAGQPFSKRDQLLIKVPQHAMGALAGEGVVKPRAPERRFLRRIGGIALPVKPSEVLAPPLPHLFYQRRV